MMVIWCTCVPETQEGPWNGREAGAPAPRLYRAAPPPPPRQDERACGMLLLLQPLPTAIEMAVQLPESVGEGGEVKWAAGLRVARHMPGQARQAQLRNKRHVCTAATCTVRCGSIGPGLSFSSSPLMRLCQVTCCLSGRQ